MQPGSWPDTAVRTVVVRALVAGVPVDLDAVSLAAEMSSDLPVVGGGPLAITDGSVNWPQQSTVAVKAPQPFLPATFPPAIGTPLSIEVGDGMGQWWRQVTGRTDSNSGSFTSGTVQSRVIDSVDRLTVPMWHNALLEKMPSAGDTWLFPGVTGTYVTDLCARAAGFYATPKPAASVRLSAPCMGSAWPEVGELEGCSKASDGTNAPAWRITKWGLAPRDVSATWQFTSSTGAPILTVCLTPQPVGSGNVTAYLFNSIDPYGVGLIHNETGDSLTVEVLTSSGITILGTVPRNGNARAGLKVTTAGSTVYLSLRLADGSITNYTHTHASFSGWTAKRCQLYGAGSMGGLVVDALSGGSPWETMDTPISAIIRVGAEPKLKAMPALSGETALGILTEQAAAECASVWIDAYGVLRWVGRGLFETDPAVVTKTTALTVDDVPWSVDLRSVYSEVSLTRSVPAIRRAVTNSVNLIQGQAETLTSEQVSEQWLEAADGTDWILPDIGFTLVTATSGYFGMTQGSRYGGVYAADDADDASDVVATAAQVAIATSWITANKVLATTTAGTLPSNKVVTTKVADLAGFPKHLRGTGMPIVRGKGRVDWSDLTETFPTGAGASLSVANHTHACQWYVQNDTRRAELQTWLCAALAAPRPEFTVSIDADPRIELGDKVTIQDPHRTGLTLDVVVTGISQSYGADAPSMTLAGRLTRVEQTWTVADPVPAWQTFMTNWNATVGGP